MPIAIVDNNGVLRANDVDTNDPRLATGRPNTNAIDFLEVVANGSTSRPAITLNAKNAAAAGNGVDLALVAAAATVGNQAGGAINVATGAGFGTGLRGEFTINGGSTNSAFWAYPVTPVDAVFFIATRAMRVKQITLRPTVGASGATVQIRKVPTGIAIASGTVLHTAPLDLNGTANTNQNATLSATAADLELATGDALAFDVSGTTTNATGVVTVGLSLM